MCNASAGEASLHSQQLTIVRGTVLNNELQMLSKLLSGGVLPLAHILTQGLQIHGPSDNLVIIFDNFGIYRGMEGVRLRMRRKGMLNTVLAQLTSF